MAGIESSGLWHDASETLWLDSGMMSVFAKAFLTNYMIAADLLSPVGREQEHPWI